MLERTRRFTARFTAWLLQWTAMRSSQATAVSAGYAVGKGVIWLRSGLRPEAIGAAARFVLETARLFAAGVRTGTRR